MQIEEIAAEIDRRRALVRTGDLTSEEFSRQAADLWDRWLSADDDVSAIMRDILRETQAVTSGRIPDDEYRHRIQTLWANWTQSGTHAPGEDHE